MQRPVDRPPPFSANFHEFEQKIPEPVGQWCQ